MGQVLTATGLSIGKYCGIEPSDGALDHVPRRVDVDSPRAK